MTLIFINYDESNQCHIVSFAMSYTTCIHGDIYPNSKENGCHICIQAIDKIDRVSRAFTVPAD